MLQRYGRLPFWLETGLAWHFEYEVQQSIYCYPYRDGFVSITEHGGWDAVLKREFRRRKREPLRLEEFADWERGRFDDARAARSWGLVRFLATHHPEAVPAVLADLAALVREGGRVVHADGSWERIPGYEPPLEAQLAVFEERVCGDFLDQLSAYFAKGKGYRKPRE